ncbi:unnamed protein product [Parnassius apollo]|uniref:(apollo) hypothetical protein n=1 Tax=Parnassius apollo TaxID=110799 RepID=A0A8S3VZS0_PARAO|nr:unnamed protein product [Parnassius apollo]
MTKFFLTALKKPRNLLEKFYVIKTRRRDRDHAPRSRSNYINLDSVFGSCQTTDIRVAVHEVDARACCPFPKLQGFRGKIRRNASAKFEWETTVAVDKKNAAVLLRCTKHSKIKLLVYSLRNREINVRARRSSFLRQVPRHARLSGLTCGSTRISNLEEIEKFPSSIFEKLKLKMNVEDTSATS